MEAIIEPKRKIGFIPVNNNVIAEKEQHTDLGEFLKGTISGKELVKNVCDKIDEKYNTEDKILSGKQAASECNAVPLDFFISELHHKVDNHFAAGK